MKNSYIIHMTGACRVLVQDARNPEHAVKLAMEEVHKGHFQVIGATSNGIPVKREEIEREKVQCDATL